MTDGEQFQATLDTLSQDVVARVPELAELWCRPEDEGVVDLRLRLDPDSWETRERAIEAMVDLRRAYIGEISVNYSFTLPDLAFEPRPEASHAGTPIYSFA